VTAPPKRRRERPAGGGGASLGGWIGVPLILAGILYGGVLLAGRTEGFRSLVAERLSAAAGMRMTVGGSKITPGLTLILREVRAAEDVSARPEGAVGSLGRPEVSVAEAVLGFDLWRRQVRSLDLAGVRMVLVRDAAGGWQPERLAGWAAWAEEGMGLSSLAVLPATAEAPATSGGAGDAPASAAAASPILEQALPTLRIRDADIQWCGPGGEVLASWAGVQAEVTPFETTRQRMLHVGVSAREGHRASGWSFRGARAEWIESPGGRWPLTVRLGGEDADDADR
jgi:hypothetical protein